MDKEDGIHGIDEETRQNGVPLPCRWFIRVRLSILLAINLLKVACNEWEIGPLREVAWKNIRYLDALEHRSAVRDVGEGVDVRVDSVLVHLLGTSWDRD
jgi:hypothetical protein